ncbi:MAG: hypothetical protein AAGG46_10800, partial [Planctomycetota bacterium]
MAAAGGLAALLYSSPPWLVSTLIHCIGVGALAVISVAALPEAVDFKIASSFEGEEELDELVDIDLEELPELEVEEVSLDASPMKIEELITSEMVSVTSVTEIANSFQATDLATSGFGDAIEGDGKSNGKMSGATSSFFGAKTRGDRVVYIVDASNSMTKGRMETTLMEITRSVNAMQKQQSFYVIMYSDQAYPMFFPQGIDEMLPVTDTNKQKLGAWLNTVETC